MRTRQGIPSDPDHREIWLALAELKDGLPPSTQVEFATYLLGCGLVSEELEDSESTDALLALAHALEVLDSEGW